jgi:hypothetical protein
VLSIEEPEIDTSPPCGGKYEKVLSSGFFGTQNSRFGEPRTKIKIRTVAEGSGADNAFKTEHVNMPFVVSASTKLTKACPLTRR